MGRWATRALVWGFSLYIGFAGAGSEASAFSVRGLCVRSLALASYLAVHKKIAAHPDWRSMWLSRSLRRAHHQWGLTIYEPIMPIYLNTILAETRPGRFMQMIRSLRFYKNDQLVRDLASQVTAIYQRQGYSAARAETKRQVQKIESLAEFNAPQLSNLKARISRHSFYLPSMLEAELGRSVQDYFLGRSERLKLSTPSTAAELPRLEFFATQILDDLSKGRDYLYSYTSGSSFESFSDFAKSSRDSNPEGLDELAAQVGSAFRDNDRDPLQLRVNGLYLIAAAEKMRLSDPQRAAEWARKNLIYRQVAGPGSRTLSGEVFANAVDAPIVRLHDAFYEYLFELAAPAITLPDYRHFFEQQPFEEHWPEGQVWHLRLPLLRMIKAALAEGLDPQIIKTYLTRHRDCAQVYKSQMLDADLERFVDTELNILIALLHH